MVPTAVFVVLGIAALLSIVESWLALRWNAAYFTSGFRLRRVVIADPGPMPDDLRSLGIESFPDWQTRQVRPGLMAMRERWVGSMVSSNPPFVHYTARHQDGRLVNEARSNWSVLLLPLVTLVVVPWLWPSPWPWSLAIAMLVGLVTFVLLWVYTPASNE